MIAISTKNNTPYEEEVAEIVRELYTRYSLPTLCPTIIVEGKTISHSHPVITINTRTKESLEILRTVVHEQMHWFKGKQGKKCMEYLKQHYPDTSEPGTSGKNPDSFWGHIIVCFNTRKFLQKIVNQESFNAIYAAWSPYPHIEKLVAENYDQLQKILDQFGMAYTI